MSAISGFDDTRRGGGTTKRLLHIIASPRGETSRVLRVAHAFLDEMQRTSRYELDEINLFTEPLPEVTAMRIAGKFQLMSGGELDDKAMREWAAVEQQITRFLAADAYVLSVPMWNFGIPYRLKHYLDVIVQPRYLFNYTAQGPVGLATNRKMLVLSTRGGDYRESSPAHACDHVEPYLRAVLGFVGLVDVTFVNIQPVDAGGPDTGAARIKSAIEKVKSIANNF